MSEPEYFTAETHKINVTCCYYDKNGDLVPNKYHLEDGRELKLAEVQTVNCGHNPIRFVLKDAEVK
tara:strand:- start:175 stop:372 length:198 start_codon:yes stop_codon:yes gene_type:complete